MIQNLEQIEYRKGMLEKDMKPENLPLKVWRGSKIPATVNKAINEENLLNLGGAYGDKNAGDPVEYDHLNEAGPDRRYGRDHGIQPWNHTVHIGR